MPGETRISIDCPNCSAPGAAWSLTSTDPTPDPTSHKNCPADPTEADACPTCGAILPEPCVTSSGNPAQQPHAGRPATTPKA